MEDCPIYLDDIKTGRLRWQSEGGNIVFRGSCAFEEGYIYRLYLKDGKDTLLYLGIMMPERGRFAVSKSLPRETCPHMSDSVYAVVDRRRPGEEKTCPPSFSEFISLEKRVSGREEADEIFRRCGGLWQSYKDRIYFALPWSPGEELGPCQFFRYLRYFEYEGKGWCIMAFDRSGKPCISDIVF